jgi:pyocin large subunit-like protein
MNPHGLPFISLRWDGDEDDLLDHFQAHGDSVGAVTREDYALKAQRLYERRSERGVSVVVDIRGVVRVFDRIAGRFGAYSPDGATRTFMGSRDMAPSPSRYWDRVVRRARPGE